MNSCCILLSFSFEICMYDVSNETRKFRYWDNPQIWDRVTLVRILRARLIIQLVVRGSFATLNPGLD